MKNRKYTLTKKNNGEIPKLEDKRVEYVSIGCQQCIECRKQKARAWQVRLTEHIKTNRNGKFVTLTFSNQEYKKLYDEITEKNKKIAIETNTEQIEGYEVDNAIATRATRLFLENWRKEKKKSVKHWLITELGHNGTENIHLHGIIWTDEPIELIKQKWKYGFTWIGQNNKNYVGNKTINYIIKYITKTDTQHKHYKSKILTSPGIGSNYINTYNAEKNKYIENNTNENYRTNTGHKMAMPIYYRNKIYTENEKEKLWIEKLEKEIRYIRGEKIDTSTEEGKEQYNKILKIAQGRNQTDGYGTDKKNWTQEEYEKERRIMMQKIRTKTNKV